MFDSVYEWMFSTDVMEYKEGKKTHLLRVGDKVCVYSHRFTQWFPDGLITATFRDQIKVSYGFKRYFGFSWSRGNEKYVKVGDILKYIRPHKTTAKSDRLRLVCPRAPTSAGAERGKLDVQPVTGVVGAVAT